MYVKLAFSVAAHLDSEIMIMDEVLAVGDMAFQKKCLDKMRDAAKKEGRTVLYDSHNMNTIRQLCDRCIVLDKGKVVFEGDVEAAIDLYMQNNWEDLVELDLTDTPFRAKHRQGLAQIVYLRLLDKKSATYTTEENVKFVIDVVSKRAFSNINLRDELRYGDNLPVGTVPIIPLGEFAEKDKKSFIIDFNPIGLTTGKFRVDLVLFEIDEFGNSFDLELLLPAFRFEVQENTDIIWNTSSWGHIRFPSIVAQAIKESR